MQKDKKENVPKEGDGINNKKKDDVDDAIVAIKEQPAKEDMADAEVVKKDLSVEGVGDDEKNITAKKEGKKPKTKKKKEKNIFPSGKAYIKSTYNNTIVTLTNQQGEVISWANAGLCGFRGPKKATPYAAQIITRRAAEKAKEQGLKEVSVFVKGVGTGRESAVRALNANGISVLSIKDITPIPHNGCRPRKPRRV